MQLVLVIYSGHSDNAPANSLVADDSDANGYAGTGQANPSNQRRTLTLSNGEVIWDMAGNVWEWTSGQTTGGQPGASVYAWREWNTGLGAGSLTVNPFPSSTGISNANTWSSTQGVGRINSNTDEIAMRGFIRSGGFNQVLSSGVLTLWLRDVPAYYEPLVGFRVSR